MTTVRIESTLPDEKRSAHTRRESCRICDGTELVSFLSLGPQPLANSFLSSPAEFQGEPRYPLDVHYCRSCTLVQLLDVIDPEVLFRDYVYVSGTSETMAAHHASYARTLVDLLDLDDSDLVVEVASNDGALLKRFRDLGVRTLGVEPAANVAEMARSDGVDTVTEFFDRSVAETLRRRLGAARVVIGNNVLAHVDETRDFLAGCKALLEPEGLVVIEVPYIREMLERLEYDTIYHEHLCYFSVTTLMRLCEAVGLSIIRLDRVPVHGGSLRMYAASREWRSEHAPEVRELAEKEQSDGLTRLDRYERFSRDVRAHRESLRDLLERYASEGKSLAAYGAPAKGSTLLNYCGIGTELVSFTVDRNPLKVGSYMPGTHIPVLPVSTLVERQPDYALILAWNYADEIVRQQAEYRSAGGRFILPVPEPELI